ncbi:L-histidine N(alpha)-methyltransferase [Methylohalobius crimeensis]|uniref:L-histidine N(alpha)-methyltransferase n=1 Tax=Methylohalobius crimeensis TaxID=244365 RepID=UPI0003B3BC90|nr:L-histidine N(alpha)-methyltransferase [Methylohalobius crimeensis]
MSTHSPLQVGRPVLYDHHPAPASFLEDVLRGLSIQPRAIPPKYFYDQAGSQLFEAICELPEYYLTRTEIGLFKRFGHEMAQCLGKGRVLVEFGSGSSTKIRLLLQALQPAAYVPIDISREHLYQSARTLAADFPEVAIHAVCADYSHPLELPESLAGMSRVGFFPGSSIGNFEPREAEKFLAHMATLLGVGSGLLIGVDLKKDSAILEAAYNDRREITAAFNLNLLKRINRELDADFNLAGFTHHAFYNRAPGRVEMHLISRKEQTVHLDGQSFHFQDGGSIHTENSYKYTIEEFQRLAHAAGFHSERVWTDDDELFSVHYLSLNG